MSQGGTVVLGLDPRPPKMGFSQAASPRAQGEASQRASSEKKAQAKTTSVSYRVGLSRPRLVAKREKISHRLLS
jgi:hypothetical protein